MLRDSLNRTRQNEQEKQKSKNEVEKKKNKKTETGIVNALTLSESNQSSALAQRPILN